MSTPRLNAIGIVTQDLAASLEFYRKLGVDVPDAAADAAHAEAMLPDGIRLMWDTLDTVRAYDPGYVKPQGGHTVAFAFEVDSPGEVDALFAELVDAGETAHVEPFDAAWGQRYAVLRDPDGNAVDIYAAQG